MKKLSIILIFTLLSSISIANEAEKVDFDKSLELMKKQASQYLGNNPDLSGASKRAIVLNQTEQAEKQYLFMYNNQTGSIKFGVEPLYQIFLIQIDKYNKKRNIEKASSTLEKMVSEWPDSEKTHKAQKLFENIKTE